MRFCNLPFLIFLFSVHLFLIQNVFADNGEKLQRHHKIIIIRAENLAPVDINLADAIQLKSLKGIGNKRAEAIITYRDMHGPFESIEALAQVKEIGEGGLKQLQKNNPGRLVPPVFSR